MMIMMIFVLRIMIISIGVMFSVIFVFCMMHRMRGDLRYRYSYIGYVAPYYVDVEIDANAVANATHLAHVDDASTVVVDSNAI